MEKTKLPLGIQTFSAIRERGLRYVDKTGFAARLVSEGKWYFLSRPRRFGKSLFVDMLKELFEGNEKLFRGLSIHSQWDWSKRYPVLRIIFGASEFAEEGGFNRKIYDALDKAAMEAGIPLRIMMRRVFEDFVRRVGGGKLRNTISPSGRFNDLIRSLRRKYDCPVVVLVDEYDKPILAEADNPVIARKNQNALQNIYSVLKENDANIQFCLVTSVAAFPQAGMFSGANHLLDITLTPMYSAVCGYTDSDLDEVFSQEITRFDRDMIRKRYNGYSWRGDESVYNPLGVLSILSERENQARWHTSDTLTFLADFMKRRGILPIMLESMSVTYDSLLVSDIESITVEALLFQSGYMTIFEENNIGNILSFNLGYPNHNARKMLNESLLNSLFPQSSETLAKNKANLIQHLEVGDLEKLEGDFQSMFEGMPHKWDGSSGVTDFEDYFISVVYVYFLGWGLDVHIEDSTNEGRIDLAVMTPANIYLFEFNVVNGRPSGQSMEQLRVKNYANKYRLHGLPIHLVGVEFSKETKNLASFTTELA